MHGVYTGNETSRFLTGFYTIAYLDCRREPVWPSGKALGWYGKQRDLGSNPFRLSLLFKGCGLGLAGGKALGW